MTDNNVQEAASKAKSALDKIKVKKEKINEKDKAEREHVTMEMTQEELDTALGEARTALNTFAAEQQRNTPVPTDISRLTYMIDKVALVRGNPEHMEAAVKDAKEKIDEFIKQHQEQQQAQKQQPQKQQQNERERQK